MKKLAIGCGIIVALICVVAVGAAMYGMFKVRGAVVQFAEFSKIPDIEREVRVTTPFAPPASGELTRGQVDRLMTIQKRVHDSLGANAAQMQRTYKSLLDKKEAKLTDLPALMSAYRDMAAMWLEAKRTQVAALNEVGLSLEEYRWIRSASYQAIGAPFMDVDFGHIAAAVRAGRQPDTPATLEGAFRGAAPAANVKLLEPLKKALQDNIALASFGL